MSAPLVSVIVANFNGERHLRGCLDSILGQTLQDLEIVVYDDGSTDGSRGILAEFQRGRPGTMRVLHDAINRGVAHSRHQSILAARGSYLTTLDSDDYYADPRKLERELALARRARKDEGKDIIAFSNTLLVPRDAPPFPWGTAESIRDGAIGRAILCRSCFIPRDFVLSRDAYFQVGGYDLSLKLYEDWDLKIRLAFRKEFRYSGGLGTAYRRHGKGLSSASPPEHVFWLQRVFAKNIRLVGVLRRPSARKAFARFLSTEAGLSRRADGTP